MKKILFFLVSLIIFSFSFAYCKIWSFYNENFVWKVVFDVNIRTYPCTKSYVIWVAKKWQKIYVIWKTYFWYKIKFNWKYAWIWKKALKKAYYLTEKDKHILNKLKLIVKKLIHKRWENYKWKIIKALDKIAWKYRNNIRIYTIIEELKNYTKSITLQKTTEIKKNGKNILKVKQDKFSKKTKFKKHIETTKHKQTTKKIEARKVEVNYSYTKFNVEKVKKAWLKWHNDVRKKLGLAPYIYDIRLDKTAKLWAETMMKKQEISHKRHKWDSYYDYWKIADWFRQNGVVCKNIHRATFSESIAYYTAYCNKQDCTDALLEWAKKAFNFYMSEKNKNWKPHYRWIVHPLFKYIWFGIAIKKTWNNSYKFYYTTHYCTDFK